MTIAVNTRFLTGENMEGFGFFLSETLRRITAAHPEHRFIFIFDRPFDSQFIFSNNVEGLVVGPPARHPLLWKLWYDWKVPAVLKRRKADLFVSMDGFCSLRTRIAQCVVIHDLAFLHFPSFNKRSHLSYYKKNTGRFIKKVKRIATVSGFSKNDIIQHYPEAEGKIDVVYGGVKKIFQPIDAVERESIKAKYTDGKEYFLFTGAIHPRKNLIGLLKAFSLFKKRQQTGMKLVLVGRLAWKYDSFLKSLHTYKYRKDIVMTDYIDDPELSRITAAAYAAVYPSFLEGFGVPVLEAMQCGVPVITSSGSAMEEIAQGAALLADPNEPKDIAEQMMRIYKDEALRNKLIAQGKEVAMKYDWDRTASLLWESIERTFEP